MRSVPIVIALGGLWLAAPAVQAVGFGRVTTSTLLGQALNFGAVVRLDGDETLARECVSAAVESGERHLPAAVVRVSLEPGADPAERWVRVTTTTPIDEPVVAVNVTVGCLGPVSRRFVSFIDPPAIALPRSDLTDGEALRPQRIESQVAPVLAVAQALNGSDAPRRSDAEAVPARRGRDAAVERAARPSRPQRARPVVVAAAAMPASAADAAARTPKPAPRPKARVAVAAAATADAGARLKLEASAFVPAPAASSTLAAPEVAAAPVPPAASAVTADAEVADEFKRLKALEDDVKRVRDETIATQRGMAALQARLHEAEAARYANPLVYALATLSALLAMGLAGLWWRQSRSRGASPWWSAVQAPVAAIRPRERAVQPRPSFDVDAAEPVAKIETVPAVMDERPIPTVTESAVPRRVAVPVSAQLSPPTVFPHTLAPEPTPRELSVEELIDLEQQAEFFIVLGQEEAAIDLLMGHLRSTGGASPLPYLKLLEIYRRRGDRDAYERIRGRFNRRFNAYAPDWEADLQHGRSLEDHPQLMAKLQSLWSHPEKAMPMLDAALLQRDELAEPFDLPACRDLLLLYSVARDLVEHEGQLPRIDLLLPLDDDPAPAAAALDVDVTLPLGSWGGTPPSQAR